MSEILPPQEFGRGPWALPSIIAWEGCCGGPEAGPEPAHCGPGGPTAPAAWYA